MIAGSQTIADDRRRSQTIAEDRTWFYLLRSSAIVCDHDRRIAGDRRSVFPYDRRRSRNFLRSAICDPRSSAIIWKPAFRPQTPKKSPPLGVSKTQTLKRRPFGCLENSDPKDKANFDSECQRMLQAVLFRRYLNLQRK